MFLAFVGSESNDDNLFAFSIQCAHYVDTDVFNVNIPDVDSFTLTIECLANCKV